MSEIGLPPQLLTEIDSRSIRETRLTGVDQLARLASGADLTMATAARRALQGLTQDDSRSVAAAAAAALERTAVRLNPDRVDFGQVRPDGPRLVADVLVEGPPLAVATATVTVSGPGLRAMLAGHRLRIVWLPHSDWLDGSVTVRGAAGWADVRVTGQVASPWATAPAPAEEQLYAMSGPGLNGAGMNGGGDLRTSRVTILPPPPAPPAGRRRAGGALLVAGLVALVLLGGAGVAVAVTMNRQNNNKPAAVALGPAPSVTVQPSASAQPTPSATISRQELAQRVQSVDKPAVVATIKVGNEPEGVAVSPDGSTVYVANQSSKILSIVDVGTKAVSSVTLRDTPRFVTTSRDGSLVFVSMYETPISGGGVAVIDAASHKVLRYLTTGQMPYALSVGPDGRLWVPIHSAHRVELYSAGDQSADGRIELPPNPHAVGFSNDLNRAFTADHESNVVAVINMNTNKQVATVPVDTAPHSLAVSPDGRRVVVAAFGANAADLIDAVTLKKIGPIKVGKSPQSAAFAADGGHAYIVNEGDNTVSVLDGHTGKVTATVKVGNSPRAVAVSPDGLTAYVSNGEDDTISVLRVGE